MTMMMISDHPRSNITLQNYPQWNYHCIEDPTTHIYHPAADVSLYKNALETLHHYLPSNTEDNVVVHVEDDKSDDFDITLDTFSCDDFRMFEFKVKKCSRARAHDWTECPFAHPGEKARRRDPRRFHYSSSACPEFRKGRCKRGDSCEYAHGVFECWLHPTRYRTQPCKDRTHCRREVCFFAHTQDQLRVLPSINTSLNKSPDRLGSDSGNPSVIGYSPNWILYSPPLSPSTGSPPGGSLNQVTESMRRRLHVNKMKMDMGLGLNLRPPSWKMGFGSPRSPSSVGTPFISSPSTSIRAGIWSGLSAGREEPVMERVESGRELRERIYAKLGRENSLDRANGACPEPDIGWITDLFN